MVQTKKVLLRETAGIPSLESFFGWHSQYDRMLFWYDRLKADNGLEMLLAFFLNCYALSDWLAKGQKIQKKILHEAFEQSDAMRLCRVICNRSKHMIAHDKSADVGFSIVMEYRGESEAAGVVILAGGTKSDLHEIADQCVNFWNDFLRRQGLLN